MDQYRSRLRLSENFEHHWPIQILGGNSYGPIIGPYLFLGNFVWINGPESSSKVSPYTGIGPWTALPSRAHRVTDLSFLIDPKVHLNKGVRKDFCSLHSKEGA